MGGDLSAMGAMAGIVGTLCKLGSTRQPSMTNTDPFVPTTLMHTIPAFEQRFTPEIVGKYVLKGTSWLGKQHIPFNPEPKVSLKRPTL